MRTTIDAAGRVVIPKRVREQAGLRPQVPLDAQCVDGRVILEPAPIPVQLVRRGRFLVAEPSGQAPGPLGRAMVEATRERLREERGGGPR
ncbi:MAG: AbrB/MazE/SpoVT family DNA-binding domain-containing protein [Deltaproteobacteria bacterium]|nr:AbrB/MazE/SpoVT family DNA-binding domain-containing protein [Deltaproteobacteria bacterium]